MFFAARYLIYLSIAAVLLHIPVWSAQGISYGHPAFFLSMVAAELIEGVALCFAFYAAFRTFGADVEPQRFFSAFCVLSSFRLMASICLEPIRSRALSLQSTNIDEVASRISVIGSQVAGGELVVLTSAFAATIVLWCLFVGALFGDSTSRRNWAGHGQRYRCSRELASGSASFSCSRSRSRRVSTRRSHDADQAQRPVPAAGARHSAAALHRSANRAPRSRWRNMTATAKSQSF